MLTHLKPILEKAQQDNYGLGAFNIVNMETALAIVKAAKDLKAPVIIQVSETTIEYAGLNTIVAIVKTLAEDEANKIPIALHLDHGKSFKSVKKCIDAGFSSIHIDVSLLPFKDNIELTKQAVAYAHEHNVLVQGELGILKGVEDKVQTPTEMAPFLTDPDEAKEFVEATGVDTLAVSIGNMHGIEKIRQGNVPDLDLARLEKIHEKIPATPIVLHGASGVNQEQISAAIQRGVRIINIDTELRLAFTEAIKNIFNQDALVYDPRKVLSPAIAAVQKIVAEKIKMFGSKNKA